MDVLVAGLVAGWAIAVPLGAIGVMIIDRGIRLGFAAGAVAGTGTAAADGFYAAVGVLAGPAAVGVLAPARDGIALIGALVLVAIGTWMAVAARRAARRAAREPDSEEPRQQPSAATLRATCVVGDGRWRVGLGFFVLTLANPMTVVYFTGVVVSGLVPTGVGAGWVWFPVGALLASLSWQWLLAGVGALGGGRHPALGRWTRWVGAIAVVALGVRGVVLALV